MLKDPGKWYFGGVFWYVKGLRKLDVSEGGSYSLKK